MISEFIFKIELIVREYGAMGVLFAAFLEEIIAPIPSSLVAMFAGFFLVPAEHTLLQAIAVASLEVAIPMSVGVTVGSLIFYTIAYYGGKPIILQYGKWFGLSWALIERTEKRFIKGHADEIILLCLRSLPFVPSVAISAFCGLIRYPVKTFIILSLIGSFIRSVIMAMIGWYMHDAYITYAEIINRIEIFVLATIIVACVSFLFLRMVKAKRVL